jgi:ferritin-like metal-binding protein YciE
MATAQTMTPLQEKVIDYLQDAHAMEDGILPVLDSMLATTTDPEVLRRLRRHRLDTERHAKMLRQRLEALGAGPSPTAEAPAVAGAWLKGLLDMVRSEKPGKNARDGYVTEQTEIAAYSLLEQLALRAGDVETARIASFIRDDEEEMARWIAGRWGKFVDATLEADGIPLPRRNWDWDRVNYTEPPLGGRPRAGSGPSLLPFLAAAAGMALGGYALLNVIDWTRRGS